MASDQPPEFSVIIASAVHDMKNSLGMLIHSVDKLCNAFTEEQKQSLDLTSIKYEAERVNNDLIQLLGIYRHQNSRLSAIIDEHHLEDIFAEQIAKYAEMFTPKGVTLEVEAPSDLFWYFDREMIQGILNNALNNAIRYTKDKILISAETRDIDGHSYLSVRVNDNGEGYPDSLLSTDPIAMSNHLNFNTGSTSLGLYFSAMVAKMHTKDRLSGKITLQNGGALGGGIFELLLP